MNNVKIKINPYKGVNIASIDEKPLSPYSMLNNYMKEPFLEWAYKLFETIDEELNDDYTLTVAGEKFETLFLKEIQKKQDSCVSYLTEDFQINYSILQRYEMLKTIAEKYGIAVYNEELALPVYINDVNINLPQFVKIVSPEDAFLYVMAEERQVDVNVNNTPKLVVIANEQSSIVYHNMVYVWKVENEQLMNIITAIIERYAITPMITDIAEKLNSISEQFQVNEIGKLKLLLEIDSFISIDTIPKLEVGKKFKVGIHIVPESDVISMVRLVSSNPAVVLVNGIELLANAVGTVSLDFYRAGENIPFERRNITTFQDNTVKRIELSVQDQVMGIGRKQIMNYKVFPEDAKDANLIQWTVNSDIANITESGEILARAEGHVLVTARTKNVESTIGIKILPNIHSIILSESNIVLYVGQTKQIQTNILPENCFDNSIEWKTTDSSVAIAERLNDGTEIVRAAGIGECIITCLAVEGESQANCKVIVESTFKKRENNHFLLSITVICAVAAMVCLVLQLSLAVGIAAAVTIVSGIGASLKNKSDIFWVIVLILIAVISISIVWLL